MSYFFLIPLFYRHGKTTCAKLIYDAAPDIVNSGDAEGNTALMLTYKEDAGVPCRSLLGKKWK